MVNRAELTRKLPKDKWSLWYAFVSGEASAEEVRQASLGCPELALLLAMAEGASPETRWAVRDNPRYAAYYAVYIDGSPHPLLRPAIESSPEWALKVAGALGLEDDKGLRKAVLDSPRWAFAWMVRFNAWWDEELIGACLDGNSALKSWYALSIAVARQSLDHPKVLHGVCVRPITAYLAGRIFGHNVALEEAVKDDPVLSLLYRLKVRGECDGSVPGDPLLALLHAEMVGRDITPDFVRGLVARELDLTNS